jgi:pSer/pThr/pTyr-binding forkhead associated (FHA) protein
MASLIVIAGPNEGEYFSVHSDTTVIGRGDDCEVQLADERASRNHSRVVLDTSQMVPGTTIPLKRYMVEDLGSSNGTSLNGDTLQSSQQVEDGQVIGVGGTRLLFTLREFGSAEEALKEITRIGQGSLADAASHWPMTEGWKDERTLTD